MIYGVAKICSLARGDIQNLLLIFFRRPAIEEKYIFWVAKIWNFIGIKKQKKKYYLIFAILPHLTNAKNFSWKIKDFIARRRLRRCRRRRRCLLRNVEFKRLWNENLFLAINHLLLLLPVVCCWPDQGRNRFKCQQFEKRK